VSRPASKPGLAYDTYVGLIQQIDSLVTALEHHPDEATREQVLNLLRGLDTLHREGLVRLVGLLRAVGADAVLEQALGDPVVRTLLGLYDLAELDVPPADGPAYASSGGFVSMESVLATTPAGGLRQPVWVEIAQVGQIPPGGLLARALDDLRLLLARVEGDIYAFSNACVGTDLPLEMGHLRGHELICPWHGCLYDARSGRRLDGGPGRLQVYPVAIRGGSIQLAQMPRAARDG
jgi:nitrite reductase/ring-hydroxylating ferredoxin subunit